MDFDTLIGPLLDREGGYVNHASDRGGPTNMGITQKVYADWLASHALSWRDVRGLTRDEATRIYFELYWTNARCHVLPEQVRDVHFDAAVNHGGRRAALLLQAAAGVEQDGVIGMKTLAAVADMNPDLLRMRYIVGRYRFYSAIVKRDRSQRDFLVGWLDRMEAFA
jgi:lysozyme family protein